MRFDTSTRLCLLAASFANALPAPQEDYVSATPTLPTVASKETNVALDQLAELAKFALDNTKDFLDANSKQKRGLCSLSNLSIRKEWYVRFTSFGYFIVLTRLAGEPCRRKSERLTLVQYNVFRKRRLKHHQI